MYVSRLLSLVSDVAIAPHMPIYFSLGLVVGVASVCLLYDYVVRCVLASWCWLSDMYVPGAHLD